MRFGAENLFKSFKFLIVSLVYIIISVLAIIKKFRYKKIGSQGFGSPKNFVFLVSIKFDLLWASG